MYSIEVKGTAKVIKNIRHIEEVLQSEDIKVYLAKKMIEVINNLADERLYYDANYIKHNKYKIGEDYILIYNDVENESHEYYSLILEYGSGLYAEKEHIGKTKTFIASGYMYWYVPEEEAPELIEYPYERIETEQGVLYKVYGQTPKHIYEDSAKEIEESVAKWVREYMKKEIGG